MKINSKNNLLASIAAAASLAIASLGFSSIAHAADNNDGIFFGKDAPGKWIVGVKVGRIDPNVPEVDDSDTIGLVLGYEFARSIGGSGSSTFEIEYLTGDEAALDGIREYDADVLNMFFTYRSAGELYFKVKAGLANTDININTLGLPEEEIEDLSLAAGIGLGYHIGDYGVIELEYSQQSGDADLAVYGVNALLEF